MSKGKENKEAKKQEASELEKEQYVIIKGKRYKINNGELDLENIRIGDEGACELAQILRSKECSITTLNISITNIGVSGAKALAKAIRENSSLRKLDLSDNNIEDAGAQTIAEALKVNKTITKLRLANNNIGHLGARGIASALKTNSSLRELDFADNDIGDAGAEALADGLMVNKSIISLELVNSTIGARGAKFLAAALQANRTLRKLVLENNNVSDEGTQYIAAALQTNCPLTELWLANNKISYIGTANLAAALKVNRSLTKIDLSRNNFSLESDHAMQEALEANRNIIDCCGNTKNYNRAKVITDLLRANKMTYSSIKDLVQSEAAVRSILMTEQNLSQEEAAGLIQNAKDYFTKPQMGLAESLSRVVNMLSLAAVGAVVGHGYDFRERAGQITRADKKEQKEPKIEQKARTVHGGHTAALAVRRASDMGVGLGLD